MDILQAIIIAVIIAFSFYITIKYLTLHKAIQQNYIKFDFRLRNAIIEAINYAEEKGDNYEKQIFNDLIEQIQGKQ